MPSIFSIVRPPQKTTFFYHNPETGTPEFLLKIDATIQDTHDTSLEPTDHTVEDGSVISDHASLKPKELKIEGIISDTPITIESALLGNAAGLVSNITQNSITATLITGGIAGIGGALLSNSSNRVKDAYDALNQAQVQKLLLSVVTGLTSYENMLLTGLSVTRNKTTGKALKFNASLRELKITSSQTVTIPKSVIDKAVSHTATEKQNLGKQTLLQTTDKVNEKASTVLYKFKNLLGA